MPVWYTSPKSTTMLIVKHLMPVGATVDDAHHAMAQPEVAEKLGKIGTNQKSATKSRMKAVWGPEIAEIFLPAASRPGRPKIAAEAKSVWHTLAQGLLKDMADALEVDMPLSEDKEFWTEETASLASDALHARYANPHSAVVNATKFRNILKGLGVDAKVLDVTKRADVTIVHNAQSEVRSEDLQKEGINMPDEYKNIRDLKERAEAFVSEPHDWRPTSQNAADFIVIMTARPTEADESFQPGPTGGVIGVLKKRTATNEEYPIVSAVGTELARRYLISWRARDPLAVKAAMNALVIRAKKDWGLTRPKLRAIGAELAVRAAKESGEIANSGQERAFRDIALKHGAPKVIEPKAAGGTLAGGTLAAEPELEPETKVKEEEAPKLLKKKSPRKAAQDHYTRVNDPTIRICAKLSNASVDNQTAVESMLDTSAAKQAKIRAAIIKILNS